MSDNLENNSSLDFSSIVDEEPKQANNNTSNQGQAANGDQVQAPPQTQTQTQAQPQPMLNTTQEVGSTTGTLVGSTMQADVPTSPS
jgi:hypothetical protein